MRIIEAGVTRQAVIAFYVEYDRRKKGHSALDVQAWPWTDPEALDAVLRSSGLKAGVLPAYESWDLAELDCDDLLRCAIVDHIFPGEPQWLAHLADRGLVDTWRPAAGTEWWELLSSGQDLPRAWALILRPATRTEAPAQWYVEDGSGRALALLQRMRRGPTPRPRACAYIGVVPDERSSFIKSRPELRRSAHSGGSGAV